MQVIAYTSECGRVDLTCSIDEKCTRVFYTVQDCSQREIQNFQAEIQNYMKNDAEVEKKSEPIDPQLQALLEANETKSLYYKNKGYVKVSKHCFYTIFNPINEYTIATLIVELDSDLQRMELELCFHSSHLVPKKIFYSPDELDHNHLTVMSGLEFFKTCWLQNV